MEKKSRLDFAYVVFKLTPQGAKSVNGDESDDEDRRQCPMPLTLIKETKGSVTNP